MRMSAKIALSVCCALLLLSSSLMKPGLSFNVAEAVGSEGLPSSLGISLNAPGRQPERKEYNYYYDGTRWVPGWFQCDTAQEVMIFGEGDKKVRYEEFSKRQPAEKTMLTLTQTGEPDCGMMKCYYTLTAPGRTFNLLESHYLDEDAYWTSQYSVTLSRGKGRTLPERECRWFERTRLAVITDRRSIYVTESERGELQYRSYNYQQQARQPSVMLKGGRRSIDERKGIETFTFENAGYVYVLNVSTQESKPSVEVLIQRNGKLIQQERSLSYTYLKKT